MEMIAIFDLGENKSRICDAQQVDFINRDNFFYSVYHRKDIIWICAGVNEVNYAGCYEYNLRVGHTNGWDFYYWNNAKLPLHTLIRDFKPLKTLGSMLLSSYW